MFPLARNARRAYTHTHTYTTYGVDVYVDIGHRNVEKHPPAACLSPPHWSDLNDPSIF